MVPDRFKLEVCIDTPDGIAACQQDVDTIELCSALAVGGLTPSAGLIAAARKSCVPVHAMIRPRAGDFVYSSQEVDVALLDIKQVVTAGLAGVVLGAATHERTLDLPVLKRMVEASGGIKCSLHRVIDTLKDPSLALEQAIDLGFSRILTSGGQPTVQEGQGLLRKLQEQARGRIEIVAGGGVTVQNVSEIARETGVRSFHASCSAPIPQDDTTRRFGFGPAALRITDPITIAQLRRQLTKGP